MLPAIEGEEEADAAGVVGAEPEYLLPPPKFPEEKEKKKRKVFDYNCTVCGKAFTAGIKFDPSRPIYCDECLALKREGKLAERPFVAPKQPMVEMPEPVSLSALERPPERAPAP